MDTKSIGPLLVLCLAGFTLLGCGDSGDGAEASADTGSSTSSTPGSTGTAITSRGAESSTGNDDETGSESSSSESSTTTTRGETTDGETTSEGTTTGADCSTCSTQYSAGGDNLCPDSAPLWDAFTECACAADSACETECAGTCGGDGNTADCFFCAYDECSPQLSACVDDLVPECVDDGMCAFVTEDCSCADCMTTALCVPDQCADDGVCTLDDSCTCDDCSDAKAECPGACNLDGTCESFYEGCDCADCTEEANCAG